MKITSALIALVFLFEQAALADQPARTQLDLAQAAALLESSSDVTAKADAIDGALSNHSPSLAAQENEEGNLEEFNSAKGAERIQHRWKRIFTRNAPKALAHFQSEVAKMSDEQAMAQVKKTWDAGMKSSDPAILAATQQWMQNSGSAKSILVESFKSAQPALIEGLSNSIAQAGGIVPYVIQLRSAIAKQKAKLAVAKKNGLNREIANDCSVGLSILVLLGVFVIFMGGIFLAGLFVTATSILLSVVLPIGIFFGAGELEALLITSSGCFAKNRFGALAE